MEIKKCRICGNSKLDEVLFLGELYFTGIFPKKVTDEIPRGLLRLVKCVGDDINNCGALQLRDSFPLPQLYGENYGYRSSLNISMVNHLKEIVIEASKVVSLKKDDIILDIGSNDGTLLSFYPDSFTLVGIDPTGKKFQKYYRKDIILIPEFFSKSLFFERFKEKKAKIITSIAMFYDLEDPIAFAKDIRDILDKEGIWIFEQSYTPNIFKKVGYDTICHEHLLYYSLRDILWILHRAELKIINIKLNNVNGASIRITAARSDSSYKISENKISAILNYEKKIGFYDEFFLHHFREKALKHRIELNNLIDHLTKRGKNIFGYGASTKGNVILQFCGIDSKKIPYIAEVNEDKFGAYTPGTLIPIISEDEAKKRAPDYFLVLPWHFKEGIIKKEANFLKGGGKLIFPLPKVEVFHG